MRKTVSALLLVAGLQLVGTPSASPVTSRPYECPTAKPLVVDVTLTVRNLADVGSDGHVWALDDFTEHTQVWQLGPKLFCARRESTGSFTSFAGVSPAGTGTISAGVTGELRGIRYLRLIGEFDPSYPTTGYLGEFDGMCQQDGICPGILPRLSTLYFSPLHTVSERWYDFVFTSDGHGTWHESPAGDTGDITG
jgi:hypothetical protein